MHTKSFPGTVKPVRPGVYLRLLCWGWAYSRWNGAHWCMSAATPWTAGAITEISGSQDLPWKGLSNDETRH